MPFTVTTLNLDIAFSFIVKVNLRICRLAGIGKKETEKMHIFP